MSSQYAAASMIGLEFMPTLPVVSPAPVTVREAQIYAFDLTAWAPTGGSVSGVTVRLEDQDADMVANAVTCSLSGSLATVTANWTTRGIGLGREYLVWVTASLSDGEIEEGFARFLVALE